MSVMAEYDYSTMLEWALHYARARFDVFPVAPDKSPLTVNGFYDGTTDTNRITDWWTRWPNALIGCRVPTDVVILDVDPRHNGHDVWKALQDSYGPIKTGREHRSGRNDGGAQFWFQRPTGQLAIKPLTDWSRKNGVGQPVGANGWTCGIDILHHTQRYTILPPSPHPATGAPYTWHSKSKPVPMPGWLAQLITKAPPAPPKTTLRIADTDSIADWYSSTHSWNEILGPAGWELVSGDGDSDGSKWRHPNASAATSSSIKHGCLFVYTPNTEFDQTEDGDTRGYTRFRAWATLEHGGDLTAAARVARDLRGPNAPSTRTTAATPAPAVIEDDTALNDEFWNARPYLTHIRQAAIARMVAPSAVLGCILARVGAFTPPSMCLPALVGETSTLSIFAALYAHSGGGKSSAAGCAAALLPELPPGCAGPLPLGSGEGLVDSYFEMTEDVDGGGKKTKVKRQTRHGALFYLDEGQVLAELGKRSGSTTAATIRSSWTGTTLGQANASIETKRLMRAGTYSIGIVSLWQLNAAMSLIGDSDGGTPQRFVWFNTTSLEITEEPPGWPGPLEWTPPPAIVMGGFMQQAPMVVHADVEKPIRALRAKVARGEMIVDPLDTHRNLAMLKVAGCLAVLDGRKDIRVDDWELAGRVMRHSDGVRSWIIAESARVQIAKEEARTKAAIARDAMVEGSAAERALTQGAKAAWRATTKAADGKITRRMVHQAMASRIRQAVTIDDAIAEAVRLKWLAEDGEGQWKQGDASPR